MNNTKKKASDIAGSKKRGKSIKKNTKKDKATIKFIRYTVKNNKEIEEKNKKVRDMKVNSYADSNLILLNKLIEVNDVNDMFRKKDKVKINFYDLMIENESDDIVKTGYIFKKLGGKGCFKDVNYDGENFIFTNINIKKLVGIRGEHVKKIEDRNKEIKIQEKKIKKDYSLKTIGNYGYLIFGDDEIKISKRSARPYKFLQSILDQPNVPKTTLRVIHDIEIPKDKNNPILLKDFDGEEERFRIISSAKRELLRKINKYIERNKCNYENKLNIHIKCDDGLTRTRKVWAEITD